MCVLLGTDLVVLGHFAQICADFFDSSRQGGWHRFGFVRLVPRRFALFTDHFAARDAVEVELFIAVQRAVDGAVETQVVGVGERNDVVTATHGDVEVTLTTAAAQRQLALNADVLDWHAGESAL